MERMLLEKTAFSKGKANKFTFEEPFL